jgi:hypothetical protein
MTVQKARQEKWKIEKGKLKFAALHVSEISRKERSEELKITQRRRERGEDAERKRQNRNSKKRKVEIGDA